MGAKDKPRAITLPYQIPGVWSDKTAYAIQKDFEAIVQALQAAGISTTGGGSGTPGLPGAKGDPGAMGVPGLDAVELGFSGDESFAFPGRPGDPGPQGFRGAPGLDGLDAEDGQDSLIPGPPGPTGPTGPAGSGGSGGGMSAPVLMDGEPGEEGVMGLPGMTTMQAGPAGPQGLTGLMGPPSFLEGDPGDDGIPGFPGRPGQDATGDGFGTRVTGLSADVVYGPADHDGLFVVEYSDNINAAIVIDIRADTSNPPTTSRGGYATGLTTVTLVPINTATVPVKRGEYYTAVTLSSTGSPIANIYFVPVLANNLGATGAAGPAGSVGPPGIDGSGDGAEDGYDYYPPGPLGHTFDSQSPQFVKATVVGTATPVAITRQVAGDGGNKNAMSMARDTTFGGGTPTNNDAVGFVFQEPQTGGALANVAAVRGVILDVTSNVATGALDFAVKDTGDPTAVFETVKMRLRPKGSLEFFGTGHPQGVVAAPIGALFVDSNTGYAYDKLGGAATVYGWYLRMPGGAAYGRKGPLAWQNTFSGISADASAAVRTMGFGPFQGGGADTATDALAPTNNQGNSVRTVVSSKLFGEFLTAAVTANSTYLSGASSGGIKWLDDDLDLCLCMCTGSDIASLRFWFGMSTAVIGDADTIGLTNGAIMFRYSTPAADGGWVGFTSDAGGGSSVTATVAAIAASTIYSLRIRFVRQGTPTVYFSVNDGTEISTTTRIPPTGKLSFPIFGATSKQASTAKHFLWRSIGAVVGS